MGLALLYPPYTLPTPPERRRRPNGRLQSERMLQGRSGSAVNTNTIGTICRYAIYTDTVSAAFS